MNYFHDDITSLKRICRRRALPFVWRILLVNSLTAGALAAQAPVDLGSATRFAVLSGTSVTNVGGTVVTGNLGVSPGSSVTGFPPGVVTGTIHAADLVADQGKDDLVDAYTDAAGRTSTDTVVLSGDLGKMTLTPGLYRSASSLEISSGDLTLDGQGDPNAVFLFQMDSTLTVLENRQVLLVGGARAANIFWQVGSSATLGTYSVFQGNILAAVSITITTGAALYGRALAIDGAVSMDSNAIDGPITGAISGHLFDDWNGDGVQGVDEPGLAGVAVLITDSFGAEQTRQTDSAGNYQAFVPPGTTTAAVVRSSLPEGYSLSTSNDPQVVEVVGGETVATSPVGFAPTPLLVSLDSFTAAQPWVEGPVFIRWETAAEFDNAGFHLYCGIPTGGGNFDKGGRLTEEIIPAMGSETNGASYEYVDEHPVWHSDGIGYFLEDIDLLGKSTLHGPVETQQTDDRLSEVSDWTSF